MAPSPWSAGTVTFIVGGDPTYAPDRPGTFLALHARDALDLLEWLGLERERFGARNAWDVAARCRRRLWPERRNYDAAFFQKGRVIRAAGSLRGWASELLRLAERAGSGDVLHA
jgi:hypothetical protein